MNVAPLSTGTLVFFGIAVGLAVLSHWRIRRFWRASLICAVATPVVFFIASTIQGGLPDPLYPIAFLYFAVSAFLIAAVVGLFFLAGRRLILFRNSRLNGPGVGV